MRTRQADYVTCETGFPMLLEQSNIYQYKKHHEYYQKHKQNNYVQQTNQSQSPRRLLPLRESITEYYNRELGIGVQQVEPMQNGRDYNYTKVYKNRYNEQIKANQTTTNRRNCLIKKTQQQQHTQPMNRSARVAAQLSEQSSTLTLEDEQNAF